MEAKLIYWLVIGLLAIVYFFQKQKAKRRNRSGMCAKCNQDLGSDPVSISASYHTRYYCRVCGGNEKRNDKYFFIIFGVVVLILTGLIIAF